MPSQFDTPGTQALSTNVMAPMLHDRPLMTLLILLSSIALAAPVSRPPVLLGQGEQRVLQVPRIARYAVSGESFRVRVVDFPDSESENRIFIKGHRTGGGELILILKSGEEWSIPI